MTPRFVHVTDRAAGITFQMKMEIDGVVRGLVTRFVGHDRVTWFLLARDYGDVRAGTAETIPDAFDALADAMVEIDGGAS